MADMHTQQWLSVVLLIVASGGYGLAMAAGDKGKSSAAPTSFAPAMAEVRKARILFSHHSVGANIVEGIKRLDSSISGEGRLRVLTLQEAAASKGPALIEFSGGSNGEPKTKIDSFAATIRQDARLKPDLAFMKLCYVDFDPQTDVDDLFTYYRRTLDGLKREYPGIRFAHVTVPLTSRPTGIKSQADRLMGRVVWEDAANAKRAEFNDRLKQSFAADPIFDLSLVEATAPDGHLTTFELGGRSYLSLYPGYTEDGGHLNPLGQQVAGEEAVKFMAEALKPGKPEQ